MIHVCVPVLRRYDLLRGLLQSLKPSTALYEVHVIDNGRNEEKLREAAVGFEIDAIIPKRSFGVAESWNWFIKNIPEERIISNDDIVFAPDSLERMVATPHDLAWSFEAGFSCFLIRDKCVETVGLFDELISPGYGYFEDQDYAMRVNGKGTKTPMVKSGHVECGVTHLLSKTLEAATRDQLSDHHYRFMIAKKNFEAKWGSEALAAVEQELPK